MNESPDLSDLISDKDVADAVRTLCAGLRATKKFWSRVEKQFISQPDFKERRESALAILAYAYGKPIERQIVATTKFEELSEILFRVTKSPEAMRRLGRLPEVQHYLKSYDVSDSA